MKPPVVHQPVEPPEPSHGEAAVTTDAEQQARTLATPGLVGSLGPLVDRPAPEDDTGAGADERRGS